MAFHQDLDLLRFFIRIADSQRCTKSNVQGLPIRVLWPQPHSHHTRTQPPERRGHEGHMVKTLSFSVLNHTL